MSTHPEFVGNGFESELDNRVPLLKFVAFQDVPISHDHTSPYPFLFAINAQLKNCRLNTPQPRQNLYKPPRKLI